MQVKCKLCFGSGHDFRESGKPCENCNGLGVIGPPKISPNIQLVHIVGEKPYSDRQDIGNLLTKLTGHVYVCETWMGPGTLSLLARVPSNCKTQVLAGNIRDVPSTEIEHFVSEYGSY